MSQTSLLKVRLKMYYNSLAFKQCTQFGRGSRNILIPIQGDFGTSHLIGVL